MSGSIACPSARARVDHAMIHYTHGRTAGEMAKRSHEAPWRYRDAQPQPKETTMFRTFMTAAILALTVTAAQAGDTVTVHVGDLYLTRANDAQMLATRVHDAAKTACTPEFAAHTHAIAHNNAVFQSCVNQASKSALTKYQALANAKAAARTNLASK